MVGVESSSSHIRMVLEEEPMDPKAAFFELPSPVILTLPKHPPDHKDNDSHGTIHPPPLPPPPSLWDLPTSDMLCFYQRRVDLTTTSSSTTTTTTRRLWWPALYFASIGDAQYALLHLMADNNKNNNNNKQVQKEWMTATVQEVLTDQTVPVVALLLDQHQVHLQVVEQSPVVHDDPANLPPSNPPSHSHDDQNTNNTNSLLQSPSLFVTQFYAMQKATGPLVQDDPTLRAEWWGALQQVVLFMEGWKRHNSNNHHKSTTTRVPMAVNLPPRRVSTSPGTVAGMEGKATTTTTTTTIGPRAALQVASTTAASSSLRHHQPSITKRAIPCPSFLVVSEPEDASATTTSLNEANTTTTLTTSRQDSNTDTTEGSHSSMAAERPHFPPRSEHPTPQEPPPCTTTTSSRRPPSSAQYQDVKRGLFATTAADAAAVRTMGTTWDGYDATITTTTNKATVLPPDHSTGTATTNSHVNYHQPALEPRVSSNHGATRMHGVGRLDDGQSEAKTHTFNNNTTATTTTNKTHTNDFNHKESSTSSSLTVATIGAALAVVMDLNMDPNYVPSLDPPLSNPYCSWDEAWRILDFSGWTKRLQDVASSCSSRTMAYGVKEVYVKRGCCVSQSRPGVGYFTNVSDLQDFCRREYGWKGPLARPTRTAAAHLKEGEDQDDEGVGHENEEEDDEEEEEEKDSRVRMEEGAEVPPRLSTESIISGLTMTTAGQSSFATGPARHGHPPTTNDQKDDDDDDDEQRSKSSSHTHHTFLTFFSEDKHRLDPYLRSSGWTIKPGKRLVDYYYLRPHCHGSLNANHQAGVDYFTSPEDVIAFLHQQQEQRDQLIAETTKKSKKKEKPTQEQGKKKGLKAKTKRSRKHESPKDRRDQSGKMKARKNSETTHGKSQASATTSTKSHGNPKTGRRSKVSVNQKNTKKNTNPRHLRVREAKQLLRRIGILDATTNSNVQDPSDCGKEQWIIDLSGGEKSSDNLMEPHRFTFTGLRRFLCRFGVPDKYEHAMQTELSCSEMELLSQWIRFANVPLTASEIEVALRNSPCPFVSKQELPALLDANGIQTFDGNRYLKRTKGKHLGSKRDRDYFCCLATYEQFRAESRGDHWNVNYTKPLLTKQERQEQQQSRKFKDELRFLLWLATSPSPLLRFRKPLEEVVVQYADMPDLPCNQEEYDEDLVKKDSNSTTQELCEGDFGFSPEKDVDATTPALSLDENDELLFPGNNNRDDGDPTQPSITALSTTKSFGSSSRSRKNTGLLSLSNKKPRVAKWYDTENRPEFDEVWPIFIKLGFQKHDQGFTHPAYNELVTIPTHQQLRLFVAFTGIPRQTKDAPNENTLLEANNVRERPGSRRSKKALTTNNSDDLLKELSEAESRKLMQFLIFARFPDQITTQVQAILDQLDGTVQRKEVEKFVRILGFHLVDGKYYPPGSDKHKQRFAALMNEKLMKPYQQIDSNKNGSAKRQSEFYHQQAKRVFGFHELDGLEMLKEYLRSTPCIRQTPLFDDNISIGTNEQMEEAEHFLTLWAIMKCSFEEWKKTLPSFSIGSVRYHYALEHVIFGDKGEEL